MQIDFIGENRTELLLKPHATMIAGLRRQRAAAEKQQARGMPMQE